MNRVPDDDEEKRFTELEERALSKNDPLEMISVQRLRDNSYNEEGRKLQPPHRSFLKTRARIAASLWHGLYCRPRRYDTTEVVSQH